MMMHIVLSFSGHPIEQHQIDLNILKRAVLFYKNEHVDILAIQEAPSEEYVKLLADSLGFTY